MNFHLGLERCLEDPPASLVGRRFGLLMNQASVDGAFRYAHDLLDRRFPGQLAALFGPQHGLFSEQQDNMVETPHGVDGRRGIPVYSLYSDRRKPTPEMLDGLELFVVDLQDVGTRVYTFIWTLSYCLEACAEAGVPVLVLDRPNPLGGVTIEGPALDPEFRSFVGRAPIPMRHGLTMGELARYLNASMGIGAAVEVVPMSGWERPMTWAETGRPWVPTSPNLPRFEGVLFYPGQVLLEGTTVSEGRGTTTPFELWGAPWLVPERLAEVVAEWGLPGVVLRPIRFEPTFHKHAGQSCGGFFLHAPDPGSLRSYRVALALLGGMRRLWPEGCGWLPPGYEYDHERLPIDILTGDDRARQAIDRGLTVAGLDELCAVDLPGWEAAAGPFRLYPGGGFGT